MITAARCANPARGGNSRVKGGTLALLLAWMVMAAAPAATAQTVVNGGGGPGYTVTPNSALAANNNNIVGPSLTVGNSSTQTIFTGFATVGGNGSGGGGGLGGAFFVDQGASLTLNNVSFVNNSVTGGQGGGVQVEFGGLDRVFDRQRHGQCVGARTG